MRNTANSAEDLATDCVMLQEYGKSRMNQRCRAFWYAVFSASFLVIVAVLGTLMGESAILTDMTIKNAAPSLMHPFGTDWLGRDMLARTLKGLSISIFLGICASSVSGFLAGFLGVLAAMFGRKINAAVEFLINVVMGIPHLLLLLLISYGLGKGVFGVTVAVAVTHWPSLARVIRGEVLQQKQAGYVKVAAKLGQGRFQIAKRHMIPHIFPQFVAGFILLFPHAVLHEAALTFLGFGLRPEQPGVGIILSESMKYLSLGMWWLALFPGLALLAVVLMFDLLGSSVRRMIDPSSAHE